MTSNVIDFCEASKSMREHSSTKFKNMQAMAAASLLWNNMVKSRTTVKDKEGAECQYSE